MTFPLPNKLQKLVDFSRNQKGDRQTARLAMNCLDLTSLTGTETREQILDLANAAKYNHLASACIYPDHVATAAKVLKNSDTKIATVINFPFGNKRTLSDELATPETTAEDISKAIAAGATQIDIVLPYEDFMAKRRNYASSLLEAARSTIPEDVTFKVILETAAFSDYHELVRACDMALANRADCLKTSTGKHPAGGATLEAAAVLLDCAQRSGRVVGCKIAGGVKTNDDCAAYMTLARSITKDWDPIQPQYLRFGSSSLLGVLLKEMDVKPPAAPLPPALSY